MGKIINNFFRWLGFKPDDWVEVWAEKAPWLVKYGSDVDRSYEQNERAFYYIHYSASRRKFKLTMSGFKPELHSFNIQAHKQLIAFNLELLKNNQPVL